MSSPTTFLDASVLYPAPLRDFLMFLALTDIIQVKWSQRVHKEWIEALLRNRPDLTRRRLERTRDLMNAHMLDALVEDYEDLIEQLSLPDPDDRHVLAAAIKSQSDLIITFNLKDFPETSVSPFGIEVQHPDLFLLHLLEIEPLQVISAANEHRQNLKNPSKSVADYLDTLERHGLIETVAYLREFAELI